MKHYLLPTYHILPTYLLPTINSLPTYHLLPSYYQPPTIYYLLPTIHNLLSSTYHELKNASDVEIDIMAKTFPNNFFSLAKSKEFDDIGDQISRGWKGTNCIEKIW